MGKENWMRGFVDNRINHAATHAYTPVIAGSGKSDNCDSIELSKFVDKTTGASAEGAPDMSQKQENHSSSLLDAEIVSTVSTHMEAMDAPTALVKNKVTTREPTNARKNAEADISDSTDSSCAGNATSSCTQTPKECTKQCQDPISFDGKYRDEKSDETASKVSIITKEIRIEPRRYGKTPKKLKTARRSASKLPPYSPPYARLLPRAEPRNKEYTASSSHARHATQLRPRVENALQTVVADNVLPASDRHLQQPNAAVRRVLACESKPSDESVSRMKSRAPLANATLRADEKLRNMKTRQSSKLAELTEKAAEIEEIQNKCAALRKPIDSSIRTSDSQQEGSGDSQVRSLTPDVASETQGVTKEALPLGNSSYDSFKASKLPTFAKRSLLPTNATRRLELALDNVISKQQGHNLNAATTPAELDAIKAELLRSPEVLAAIARIKYPSYGWVAPTGISSRERSSLSNGNFGCAFEEVKKPQYLKSLPVTGQSARRPSQRSSSQQLGRSWRYNRKSEARFEESQDLSTCSVLSGPPPADHSTFGFSVNDNFSINQWYRDLYPKSFGFQ
ncbi:unnamed protein product [Peronospora destructor]|uniref:TPX2 central domain-containing protein n=1 Tax=Peronospora destructor TaxID=86335 RepID=A0AAV0TRN1_9STRA|nr:unnamed protein product [Peronospora destructor]